MTITRRPKQPPARKCIFSPCDYGRTSPLTSSGAGTRTPTNLAPLFRPCIDEVLDPRGQPHPTFTPSVSLETTSRSVQCYPASSGVAAASVSVLVSFKTYNLPDVPPNAHCTSYTLVLAPLVSLSLPTAACLWVSFHLTNSRRSSPSTRPLHVARLSCLQHFFFFACMAILEALGTSPLLLLLTMLRV
ncbi:hypothetical protein B0H19DRAFT_165938 [Mycena capillaripes]|nr:hypothetical protein B0H19DRAFT_165938 [Mycena capillaripes]